MQGEGFLGNTTGAGLMPFTDFLENGSKREFFLNGLKSIIPMVIYDFSIKRGLVMVDFLKGRNALVHKSGTYMMDGSSRIKTDTSFSIPYLNFYSPILNLVQMNLKE